jgi:hypothetical protein
VYYRLNSFLDTLGNSYICNIVESGIGCNVGGKMINVLPYAIDIVIIASSWHAGVGNMKHE